MRITPKGNNNLAGFSTTSHRMSSHVFEWLPSVHTTVLFLIHCLHHSRNESWWRSITSDEQWFTNHWFFFVHGFECFHHASHQQCWYQIVSVKDRQWPPTPLHFAFLCPRVGYLTYETRGKMRLFPPLPNGRFSMIWYILFDTKKASLKRFV